MPSKEQVNNINLMISKLHQELSLNPYNPEIYCKLAKIYYQIKDLKLAINYYKRALNILPSDSEIYLRLANCYVQNNDLENAIYCYKNCLELNPKCLDAMQNLGMLLITTKEFNEALNYLQPAYELNPENQKHFAFIEQLANCYLEVGNFEQAINYFKLATELDPSQESALHNLGILYLKQQDKIMANKYFQMAYNLNPNNQTAKHMLNALNKVTPEQPPTEYVNALFNQYASYYEAHVTNQLKYDLPLTFRNLYAKHATITSAKYALDLGCGTGLCGIYFRDASINLIGVDLSREMLLQAKKHQCYDLLIENNLQQNLGFKNNYFDLIIAGDLLPYFGNLENLFYNIIKILNINNNMFMFNIELSNRENLTDFTLQSSGRYTHNINYIYRLANQFNFTIKEEFTTNIRIQNELPVKSQIFLLSY